MNRISTATELKAKSILLRGESLRFVVQEVGIAKKTAARILHSIRNEQLTIQCGCGRIAGHLGWCKIRINRSPRRRQFLEWFVKSRTVCNILVRRERLCRRCGCKYDLELCADCCSHSFQLTRNIRLDRMEEWKEIKSLKSSHLSYMKEQRKRDRTERTDLKRREENENPDIQLLDHLRHRFKPTDVFEDGAFGARPDWLSSSEPSPIDVLIAKEESESLEGFMRKREMEAWSKHQSNQTSAFKDELGTVSRSVPWTRWNERRQHTI